jgi:hypothetical protein
MTDPDDTLRLILARLDQVSTRQELIVTGIHGLADILEVLGEQVSVLVEWVNEPPSTALADAMKGFEAALTALGDAMLQSPDQVAERVVARLR